MTATAAMEIVDSHHHLWRYNPGEYPWMSSSMAILRKDYLLPELHQTLSGTGVTGTVAVQARQSVEETEWLSDLAEKDSVLRGVVGWAPLAERGVGAVLERLAALPKIKGMRHVLHDEPDDFFMLRDDFGRGLSLLEPLGLAYDILISERHLPQSIELVDRHPKQRFIVDHVAKPRIREGALSPWRENLAELARRPHVYCKLSGMVTEADWAGWKPGDLAAYIEIVLEAFGPQRVMFGSDWPVLTLACTYGRWLAVVRDAVSRLSDAEQRRILAGTAAEVYRL